MAEQELTYQEVMAALPGYVAGLLNADRQAAVDRYLAQQITLFRHLDKLEEATGVEHHNASMSTEPHAHSAFSQVMEGERPPQQMANNPLLMRHAPQSYIDRRTGQRFVIPKRGTLHEDRAPRSFPAPPVPWSDRLRRLGWNLLAVAAVVAVLLISAYQLQLQRQLAAAQAELTLISHAESILRLRGNSTTATMQGTLFLQGEHALFTATALPPLENGQVYQLWCSAADGTQYSGGLLTVRDDQTAQQLITLPVAATAIVGAGVSVEPAGGSATPTSPMMLQAKRLTE